MCMPADDFDWDSCCGGDSGDDDLMDVELPGRSGYVPDDVVTGRVPHAPSRPRPLRGRAPHRQMPHGRSDAVSRASSKGSTRASSKGSSCLPAICEDTSCCEDAPSSPRDTQSSQLIRTANGPVAAHGTGFRAARMQALNV
ncbi:unnamed protein product [Polarella glacialis]|uniref:Uncharacterized protein n=1 Tax=Polarella glacialis TaxID=89957 RepID=A0A813K470_POLGL|nr:unnamed protein product [Polarella glacialis]